MSDVGRLELRLEVTGCWQPQAARAHASHRVTFTCLFQLPHLLRAASSVALLPPSIATNLLYTAVHLSRAFIMFRNNYDNDAVTL